MIWGLTGAIASGKSTVARELAALGLPVLDADAIARELREPGGAAHAAILARFGTADAAELRRIVFGEGGKPAADPQARADLEAILHPLIIAESTRRMAAIQADPNYYEKPVIYEAALLIETGRYHDFDGLIVVEAPVDARRARLMARDGSSADLADRILAAQAARISDEQRRAAATVVVRNDGSPDDLKNKVRELASARGWI